MENNRKEFYRKVVALVIPMALQNLINVGVMATDVIMLGKVGETVLSGASLAGQVAFILNLILFGTSSGVSVLTAQYWGKRDKEAIEKLLGIALRLALVAGFTFSVVTLLFPTQVMRIFTNEPAVISEGSKYLQILAFTYPIMAGTMIYLNLMKSVEKVVISTVVYGCSLVLNFGINAILIFGLFGAPKLGIIGAAIGTLCARILELVIVVVYARNWNKEIKVRTKYLWKADKILSKDFVKYSGPVVLNELLWGLGYSANAAIVGHLGSSAVAANSVTHVTRQLAMVVVFGLSNATAIMVGKAIGEGRADIAEDYAKRFVKLSLLGGICGGLIILMVRPLIIAGLGFSGLTAQYMNAFMAMMAVYVVAQGVNCTCIVGVFRAGGDTKIGLYMDAGTLWLGSILFGCIAAFVLKADVRLVYAVLLMDEAIKLPLSFWRYRQKKWLKNITR